VLLTGGTIVPPSLTRQCMVLHAWTGAALEVQGITGATHTQAGTTALQSLDLVGGGHTNLLCMRRSGSML